MNNNVWNYILGIILFLNINNTTAQNSGIEKSGDILKIALPVVAFSSTQIWTDGEEGTLQFIKAMGTTVIKIIINKERPNGGDYSFPSGHTSSAFTGAAFREKRYGWKIGIPAYLLAGYVGWTRVYENKHDYWDVLGGAIVGIGSAYLFTKPYNKNSIKVSFGKYNDSYIIGLNYQF